MNDVRGFSLHGKQALIATMHAKERVIGPLLQRAFGLQIRVPEVFDTDRFGTFSREIERAGSQLDAARAKIAAAFAHEPAAKVAVASEGSFGPHPLIPFVPFGREIVVIVDRDTGLELIGQYADVKTNFGHETVVNVGSALAFAKRIGFPAHGVFVAGAGDGGPALDRFLCKNMDTETALRAAVTEAIAICGAAHIETDMRAHRNPTRMRAIKRATIDLVRRYRSICPTCARPGFAVTERVPGLPCAWCGTPTDAVRTEVSLCAGCGHRMDRPVGVATADPGFCNSCNP